MHNHFMKIEQCVTRSHLCDLMQHDCSKVHVMTIPRISLHDAVTRLILSLQHRMEVLV